MSSIFSVKKILLHIPILFLLFFIDKYVWLFHTGCELLLIKMYIHAIYIHQMAHLRFKFVLKRGLSEGNSQAKFQPSELSVRGVSNFIIEKNGFLVSKIGMQIAPKYCQTEKIFICKIKGKYQVKTRRI